MMSIMITVHIIRSSFRGRDDYPLWWGTPLSLELIQAIVGYFAYVASVLAVKEISDRSEVSVGISGSYMHGPFAETYNMLLALN